MFRCVKQNLDNINKSTLLKLGTVTHLTFEITESTNQFRLLEKNPLLLQKLIFKMHTLNDIRQISLQREVSSCTLLLLSLCYLVSLPLFYFEKIETVKVIHKKYNHFLCLIISLFNSIHFELNKAKGLLIPPLLLSEL